MSQLSVELFTCTHHPLLFMCQVSDSGLEIPALGHHCISDRMVMSSPFGIMIVEKTQELQSCDLQRGSGIGFSVAHMVPTFLVDAVHRLPCQVFNCNHPI